LPAQIGILQNKQLMFKNNAYFPTNTPRLTDNQIVNEFRKAFKNAVSQRKTNDISAANLSGGLGSSSVVEVLSLQINRKLSTIYFDAQKPDADERDFARSVVEKYQTNYKEVTAPKSLFKSLTRLTEKIAQPDPRVLPSFIHEVIFEEIEKTNAKRLFSGHGGDNVTRYGFEFLDNLFHLKQWKKLKEERSKYDELRQNDEPIIKSIFKLNIKKSFQQKEFWNALKLTFICLFYFGTMPLPDKCINFKNKRTQLIGYEQFESNLLKVNSIEKASAYQIFEAANVPITFTQNQQKHVGFSFIRLAINGN
jgi:asparagine synthetase B (glutamine-hydrolysing)